MTILKREFYGHEIDECDQRGPGSGVWCTIALAMPAAQAQTYNDWGGNPARNNAESAKYDHMVQTSPGFRQARMRKECGPITDPQLRESCVASFAQYEPSTGSRGRTIARGTTTT